MNSRQGLLGTLVALIGSLNCTAFGAVDWGSPNSFGAVVNLGSVVNSSSSEGMPSLTGNELTILFTSGGPGLPARPGTSGPSSLWTASRRSADASWSTPVRLESFDSPGHDIDASITADGLELFFTSGSPLSIWTATRSSVDGAWSVPSKLPSTVNTSSGVNAHGAISADGLNLVFHRHPSGAPQGDLFIVTRSDRNESWSDAVALPSEINTNTHGEAWPHIAPDGLTLLFTRYPEPDFNGADIYASTRDSLTSPWTEAVQLPPGVNQSGILDGSPWLSPDGQRLYFSSGRSGGQGSVDLWVVAVVPEPSAFALIAVSGLGLLASGRRRRTKCS